MVAGRFDGHVCFDSGDLLGVRGPQRPGRADGGRDLEGLVVEIDRDDLRSAGTLGYRDNEGGDGAAADYEHTSTAEISRF